MPMILSVHLCFSVSAGARSRAKTLLMLWLSSLVAMAHVGSPNVFYEGEAGPYPVRVIIRPPGVVPGLAEIHVRILAGEAGQVSVLPVHWEVGTKGAPPADQAKLVSGETNLFSAELWLMDFGAYSVFVNVEGAKGRGTAVVPLNSVATQRLTMSRWFGSGLLGAGILLFLLLLTIVGAAVRESVLAPGLEPDRRRRWRAIVMMAGACVCLTLALAVLGRWWNRVDARFQRRLYQSVEVKTAIRAEGNTRALQLTLEPSKWTRHDATTLVPDHGKLIHLFLMREPDLDSFAHLHPVRIDSSKFETPLPPIPAGLYNVYADVTHESGFTQTLISRVTIPESTANSEAALTTELRSDPDDSWHVGTRYGSPSRESSLSERTVRYALDRAHIMAWEREQPLVENRETMLRFVVTGPNGGVASLESYMGMAGHAIIRHQDGSVFTHLHPRGSISMASQQRFLAREEGRVSSDPAWDFDDKFCGRDPNALSFPYAFPRAGSYRIWVQMKVNGKVMTGVFDAEVESTK